MADFTLTPNLKLRLVTNLTSDALYNLQRIDTLASLYQVDSNAVAHIRSATDISLTPQDVLVGGSGTGGNVTIGTVLQPIANFTVYANNTNITGVTATQANALTTATGIVTVSGAAAPSIGQALIATSPTTASWQNVASGSGTVTSVALSGGSTGLSISGSPITTSGTFTISGTLSVLNGGTGVTTATGTGSVVRANSPTLTAPDLGTPSALIGTNITGTAAGLTAGNVTTNANLTGVVTSVGNATSIANGAISNAMLANSAVANLSGTNTGDQTTVSGNSGTTTAALGLKTATTTVSISGATAPTNGQALIATSSTTATWQTLGGGSGTVTSVAMTVPSFLSISGSPITTSGTLALSLSGTALPISSGGTNSTTALNNNRIMQSSSGTISEAAAITASRLLISDANGIPTHSGTTSTEAGYLSGVTSAIQTQLNSKQSTALTSAHILVGNGSNVAADAAMSGDVSINNTGVTTVGSVGGSSASNIHSAELAANAATSANTASTIVSRDSSGDFSAGTITASLIGHSSLDLPLSGGTLTGDLTLNADPTNALHAATKQYVDSLSAGLDVKPSVLCATTANITLSGEQTLDGITTSASRVLVKNQSSAAENGIYVSASGSWTRAADMNSWANVPGAFCFIETGTLYADTAFVCTADAGGTLGTTAITFSQFAGAGTYTAGTGLTLTGTQFAIDTTVATLTGGLLAIAKGGTNSGTALNNNRIMQSSGGAIVESAAITASRALASDANGIPVAATTTTTELNYVSGVTSAIQTQIDGKQSTTLTSAHLLVGNGSNVATDVAVSGDLTLANTGAFTVGSVGGSSASNVHSAELAANAATATPTASTISKFDANSNLSANNLIDGYTTTATAAGTTTLTVGSSGIQYFTGSTTQTVLLPVTSTLVLGLQFRIINLSSDVVTVQSSGGNTIQAMAASSSATFTCILTSGTGTASWNMENYTGGGSGTVTSVAMSVPSFLSISGSPITTSGTLALTLSGTALPAANGGTGVTSIPTSASASNFAAWDSNVNLPANNHVNGYTTTAKTAGTTTLTASSTRQQFFTGSNTHTVVLPVTSTLTLGHQFEICDIGDSGGITVKSSGNNTIMTMLNPSGGGVTSAGYMIRQTFTCISTSGTGTASWAMTKDVANTSAVPTDSGIVVYNGTTGTAISNSGVTISQSSSASTAAQRDANQLLFSRNFIPNYTTIVTAASTTTLTNASNYYQFFTGNTAGKIVKLPVTSTLNQGLSYEIYNISTVDITINSSGSNLVQTMAASTRAKVTCILTSGTDATSWQVEYLPLSATITGTGNQVLATSPTLTTPVITGVSDASSAAAGKVGELVESKQTAFVNAADGSFTAVTSISLTAGDWDICAIGLLNQNGAVFDTTDDAEMCIGTTSASSTGTTIGYDIISMHVPYTTMDASDGFGCIPRKAVTINSTTTYYLNMYSNVTAGTARYRGSLSARRIR